ncbi:hypothetical protein LCGC14_2365000, partial [marine sediment metagenome]
FQGQEGLEFVQRSIAQRRPYAMAFIDMRMPPGWDGLATTAHLWRECPDLQVVICSAYSDYSWERIVRELGYSDQLLVLSKPFDNIEVRQLAYAQTEKWHLMRQASLKMDDLARMVNERTRDLQLARNELLMTNEQLSVAKQAAEEANQSKSEFLANISHEIRTPMTSILGYADLLMSHEWPPGERREHLQVIHRQGNNLLTIINDILDLSKIEAEQVELEPMDCSPSEIAEEVHSLLQVRANEKNLGLNTTYAYPLPKTIRTDSLRLRQILVNLVGNAIKFTERGSVKVRVRCTQPESALAKMQFEITDTGIGLSEEEIARLFRPFTQADMSHTRRFGGIGLGLHISQKLAKMLGGQIEVESEPGVGSTFTLTIDPGPLEDMEMETTTKVLPKTEEPIKRRTLHGRLLLAEDVPEVQTLVRMNLEAAGLETDSAENGKTAVEKALASKAEGKPYDLILMDIQMPELNGFEATRRLRQEGWNGPIIALTAHAMSGDREECLEAGCDDYISKPMTDEELFDTVARHLEKASPSLSASAARR